MVKILTYVNTAVLLIAVGGGSFVYMKRADFVNDMIFTVQDQLIKNIQSQIQIPSIPNTTGPTLPFNR